MTDHYFYVSINSSLSTVLSALNTLIGGASVTPWPIFKPQSHTFSLTGQRLSVRASAQARITASGTSSASSQGAGYSYSPSNNVRAVTTRAAIHGLISLGTTSMSAIATATSGISLSVSTLSASDAASKSGTVTG